MKNIRAATSLDPEPALSPYSQNEPNADGFNSTLFQVWLKSTETAAEANRTLTKAGEVVTKLKSNNFWLALILSVVGLIFSIIFTICISRKCISPRKTNEQKQVEWLRTVPKSFKDMYLSNHSPTNT